MWVILCVDDEPNILASLRRLFRPEGYKFLTAGSGAEGLEICKQESVDLVVSDMRMPHMDGAEFLEQVRLCSPDTIRILLTGYADIESTVDAINKGEIFRYVAKPWNDTDMLLVVRHALERKVLEQEKKRLEALTQQQNEELKALNASLEIKVQERTAELKTANEKLKLNFITSIKVFSNLIEMRNSNFLGHSRRVADLSRKIAVRLKLDAIDTQEVFLAGLLHNIGKIGFSDTLLKTPVSQLSGDSLGQYRKHAVRGEQALMPLEELRSVGKVLRAQHERFDGKGFPAGLAGLAIPIGARILAVASDYDSLQIGLALPRQVDADEARNLIVNGRGKRYDPQVVDALLALTGGVENDKPRETAILSAGLQPGMVLARDLLTPDGLLLLTADYVLDDKLIQQIKGFESADGLPLEIYVRTEMTA